jgi:hypothetical protein
VYCRLVVVTPSATATCVFGNSEVRRRRSRDQPAGRRRDKGVVALAHADGRAATHRDRALLLGLDVDLKKVLLLLAGDREHVEEPRVDVRLAERELGPRAEDARDVALVAHGAKRRARHLLANADVPRVVAVVELVQRLGELNDNEVADVDRALLLLAEQAANGAVAHLAVLAEDLHAVEAELAVDAPDLGAQQRDLHLGRQLVVAERVPALDHLEQLLRHVVRRVQSRIHPALLHRLEGLAALRVALRRAPRVVVGKGVRNSFDIEQQGVSLCPLV